MRTTRSMAVGFALAGILVVTAAASQPPAPPDPPAPDQPPAADPPPPDPQNPEQQPPIFRTGINFVRVDAIVTDRQGRPVMDLTRDDFEIVEDNKPQTIETFRFVRIDAAAPLEAARPIRSRADEERAAANEDARIFVFFLDDYHVRLGNSMGARKPLVDFVRNQLGANDLVAVMYPLTPLDAVALTRDHESIINVLDRFEGRKFNYEPRNAIEQRYALYPAEVVERIRRQVSLSAIEGLAVKLGALREGRKAVIVVSEGYTAMLPPQLRDPVASMPGLGNPARRNPMIGENSMLEDRAEFAGQLDLQREMQEVFNAANRSNTALYTVDPRGLSTGEFDINENVGMQRSGSALRQTQDTLRVLAEETDGRAIVNRNDFGRAMQQIVTDSSAYYLLGYNSSQAPQDGKFHEVKVRVKRPGIDVRARKGYWALTPEETARAAAPAKAGPPPEVARALSSLTGSARERYVYTWVGTRRGTDGRTRVTFAWEPIPPPPGIRGADTATSVALSAASADGATHFNGPVAATANGADNGGPNLSIIRHGAAVSFEAPPGRLHLRLAINGENGALDTDNLEVAVPDLTAPGLAMATPRVYVARTPRDVNVIAKDPDALPFASRDFRRTQRLVVKTDVYTPGNAPASLSAKLLNKQGQSMADVPVRAPAAPGDPHLVDLPLASLAPGEYLLEVTATLDGVDPATELVAFRVGS